MDVLTNILTLLKKQNKKQIELTNYLGLSKNVITEWKAGRNSAYMKHLPNIAKFFGVSVGYLLNEVEDPSKVMLRTPEEEAELEEYLEAVHNNPDLRMMFSLTKNAKKEDVELAVEIIKKVLSR